MNSSIKSTRSEPNDNSFDRDLILSGYRLQLHEITSDGEYIIDIGKSRAIYVRRFFQRFGPVNLRFWTSRYVTVSYPKNKQVLRMLDKSPPNYRLHEITSNDEYIIDIGKSMAISVRKFFRQFGPAELIFMTSRYVTVSYSNDEKNVKMLKCLNKSIVV